MRAGREGALRGPLQGVPRQGKVGMELAPFHLASRFRSRYLPPGFQNLSMRIRLGRFVILFRAHTFQP
jgi:hypothetical protein